MALEVGFAGIVVYRWGGRAETMRVEEWVLVMRRASLVRVSGDLFDLRSWIDALGLGRVGSVEIGDEQIERVMGKMWDRSVEAQAASLIPSICFDTYFAILSDPYLTLRKTNRQLEFCMMKS